MYGCGVEEESDGGEVGWGEQEQMALIEKVEGVPPSVLSSFLKKIYKRDA